MLQRIVISTDNSRCNRTDTNSFMRTSKTVVIACVVRSISLKLIVLACSLNSLIDRLNEPLFYTVIVVVLPVAAAATRGPAFIVHPAV